jgi:hypothetical protein
MDQRAEDDGGRTGQEGGAGREEAAEQQVLNGVDVGDHPGQGVTVPERAPPGGEGVEDPAPQFGQGPQGGVVPGQPLDVTEDALEDREAAHGGDGQGQRGQFGLLRGPGR